MAIKKDMCRGSNGLFVRNLGWKVTPKGGYVQHKFYLGRDEPRARLANLRLEQLWDEVSQRWEREKEIALYPTDRPVWDEITLPIAEAVRNGDAVARISLPVPFSAMVPESPLIGDWLDKLQSDITVVKIEVRDETVQQHSEAFLKRQGQRLLEMGQRMLHKQAGGETLHAALDRYSTWIKARYVNHEKKPTAWAGTQGRQIAFLRQHLPDCPLLDLGAERIEELIDVIRLRPQTRAGTPVSVSWTQNCLKQFRNLLRWLNRSPEFAWRRPVDLELARVHIPTTSAEKSARARSSQVETYTLEELGTLWKHAGPFNRLLLLLGLNCGFGRAEIASLEMAEVFVRCQHPHAAEVGCKTSADDSWIMRVRQKTGVYGEFKLWPETVDAIEWWLRERKNIDVERHTTTLLVNGNGQRFDTPTKGNHTNFQIPNRWFALTERIRKVEPGFRMLSFNKLRKTAGNLIRLGAGGEIAAVFLCHGTPVRADVLLDVYTNRPFVKVFEAIDNLGQRLRPLWTH
jgi:hypothetical protein